MTRGEKAESLFKEGYNCSQAVLLAFADKIGIDEKTAALLASPFGGGMGRMREVCGAVSGMFMAAGLLKGYSSPEAREEKTELYSSVQSLAEKFAEENGSIICRELLGLSEKQSPVPEKRTAEYYKKRPCATLCKIAADILSEAYGVENPTEE